MNDYSIEWMIIRLNGEGSFGRISVVLPDELAFAYYRNVIGLSRAPFD